MLGQYIRRWGFVRCCHCLSVYDFYIIVVGKCFIPFRIVNRPTAFVATPNIWGKVTDSNTISARDTALRTTYSAKEILDFWKMGKHGSLWNWKLTSPARHSYWK
jgi:hypothetical protein